MYVIWLFNLLSAYLLQLFLSFLQSSYTSFPNAPRSCQVCTCLRAFVLVAPTYSDIHIGLLPHFLPIYALMLQLSENFPKPIFSFSKIVSLPIPPSQSLYLLFAILLSIYHHLALFVYGMSNTSPHLKVLYMMSVISAYFFTLFLYYCFSIP